MSQLNSGSCGMKALRVGTITRIKEELQNLDDRKKLVSERHAIEQFIHILRTEILPGEEK